MAAKNIEAAVEEIVSELLAGQDVIELVDVEYVKEHTDWYLRVYIDKDGGIDIEDCQELSEKLEVQLDERNVIPDSYILEVSSPGIDRVLRKPRDFVRVPFTLLWMARKNGPACSLVLTARRSRWMRRRSSSFPRRHRFACISTFKAVAFI